MPNSNFGNIQYKASNGLINLDEAQGIVECFVSGIGNKDSVGDICATGAFAKSLQRRKPRVVWGHNWNDPIGKVLEIYEVPASDSRLPMKMKMAGIGGLYAKVQFNLQSEKGKEAFANVAFFGEEQEWSIGYKTLRAQYDDNLQANVLYEVELYEVSPVLHGANQLTGTISVKSDEEKMHGMMPIVVGGPGSNAPSRENIFEEGMAQRISGSQLASVVAELSRRAGGPVMVVEATENSVVFVKPGKGKFRIGYHFTGSEYMFGKPELIQADQPKPQMQSGPSPVPGISAKPTATQKPATTNPAMPMPVAVKPGNGGMVMVPLPQVEYEGMDKDKKPELVAEERELAESLVRIAGKYGKFDEDGDGIWAGYYPPAENKVKDIGVKCSNCVLYQGEGKCKILDLKVEDEGKCRFAIIPDGVVVGYGKKEYNEILDDEEIKMVEDIEAKYPGEFILGVLRNTVKKRRKKRRSYKTLEEWGVEEQELMEKGLDPFLAQDASYVIPVDPTDAFEFKSMIDPVLEYHRIDTFVNEYGVVIASQLDQEAKDALETAALSAYGFLKKKIKHEVIEEKALGRRIGRAIGSRAIDRPNIGGKKRRGGRGLGVPSGDLDPRTRRDSNLDGTLFDNIPGWEQPDPTPDGPGSINNPKPSKRQLADAAKPDGKEKLSSGKRNLRRHADRSEDMEKQFPNAEENQKRADHEAIAKAWEDQGLGWEEVPRYNADKNLSSDYLRGREIGVNQARVMWDGDSVRKRPEKFNEKQKASQDYSNWYSSYAKSVSAYLDAHSRDDSDNWDGIESALRADVKSKYPDTQDWAKEDIATLNEYLNDIGLLDVDKLKKKKKKKAGAETAKGPDLQELRKLNAEGKLSSGKAARRDLVSGKKVPGEGKFARLIDEQMGNRNDEREPSYVARKYADALVENWRGLSDSERKEFLQDEMGSEYMPKAEEFLEILDEAWATYSQRNKKFKDIDNELQDIMDSSRLSSGDKKKPAKEKPGLSSGLSEKFREENSRDSLTKTDDLVEEYWKIKNRKKTGDAAEERKNTNRLKEIRRELESRKPESAGSNNFKEKPVERIAEYRNPKTISAEILNAKPIVPYRGEPRVSSGRSVPSRSSRLAALESALESGDKEEQKAILKEIFRGQRYMAPEVQEQFGEKVTGQRQAWLGKEGNSYTPDTEITDEELIDFLRYKFMDDMDDDLRDTRDSEQWGSEPYGYGPDEEQEYVENSPYYERAIEILNETTDGSLDSFDNPSTFEDLAYILGSDDLVLDALQGEINKRKNKPQAPERTAGKLSSGANPQASDEIRRIVETNQDIERAALYVGLDEAYEGRTSRAMGARIMADANAGNLPESDGEQLGMAVELVDEFFPDATSLQKRALEQSVFGAIARNARESRVDRDWANSQKLSSGRGKIPPTPSEFAKKIDSYDGKLSVNIKAAPNGLDLELNGKKVGRFRSNESLDRFIREVHVALKNRDGLSSGRKRESEINVDNVNKNIAELEAGGDRAKAVLKRDFRGRRYSDGTQFGSKYLGKDGDSYSTDIDITDEELEAYIRNKYISDAYESMREDADAMDDVFVGEDGVPSEIADELMPYLPFYDEALAEMQKDRRFKDEESISSVEDLYAFAPIEDLLFDTAQKQIRIRKRKLDQATLSSGMRKFDDLDDIDKQQAAKNLADEINRIFSKSKSDPDFDYGFRKFIDDSGDYERGDNVDVIRENYVDFLVEAAEKGDWETLEEHDVDLSSLLEYTPEVHPDVEMEYELDKSDREWDDMMSEMRRDLSSDGTREDEVERILDHWLYSSDSPKQEEYLQEYFESGDSYNDTFNRAAKAMYQDYLERLYDNRQERNLSSGRRSDEQESRISDREVFERRMAGESLAETASALGMKREEVRQAELRHMARERGTLQRPDFDEIETYREEMNRRADEAAAEFAFDESIYLRRMGGESLAETAKALGLSREEVRRREQKHMQFMRAMDAEAERWLNDNPDGKFSSGNKAYVSPLDDLEVGQRLSSGKLDEVYRSVQSSLIEQIEKIQESGDGKWEFPWHKTSLPKNVTNNGRPYSGVNSVMLMFKQDAMGYDMPLWAGFNQWKKEGGTVRKGEKGTLILIPTIIPKKKDADGNEIRGSGGIFFKTGHVFNIDQIDGIDKEQFKVAELPEEERVAELEQALSEIGAVVNTGGDEAFYRPSTDEIHLPPFSAFKSKEAYYAVFAHELMHWTGHSSRLKRDHLGDFGSPEYAQEELVAEIASAFFMAAHGLTPEPREDHAQYLASWLKKLKSDPDAMKKAFGEAQKAHDYAISKSPSMSAKLGKKVAEAGIIPGNDDGGYGDIGPSLSSGRREKYVKNPEGTVRTLADEMGAFGDEVLTEFAMRKGYRSEDRNWFEASAFLGGKGRPSQWNVSQDEFGEWFAELMVMDGVGENDEIDWDIAGVGKGGFKSPEDAARWADSYAESRREWHRKFRAETDFDKIAQMLSDEEARQDAEYENYRRESREYADRQEYARMMAQIDESRLEWSAEDWADEAADIQAELMREDSRFSSGIRSRYDDKPVEEIGLVTDALQRTDEAGSNSRHIASRLLAVPVDKYDFDSIRRNGEVISFTYNGKPRMVYPTGMMTKKGGGIYFVGLDEESGQYRSFSLHKIEGLIDGAIAPINPTQPGVPQGTSFVSGRRTRNVTSGRLSSGRIRPLDEVRAEIEDDARYESMVVQDAFNGRLGTEKKGEFRVTIPLEDHAEAVQSLDRLVTLRNDLLRSLLDGKRMPAGSSIFEIDKYAPVAEDEMDLLVDIDDAIDRIHDELRRTEDTLSGLNDEIEDMKGSISELEDAFRTTTRMGAREIPGPVDFESAMERNIDLADGDSETAIDLIKSDANSIIYALEEIDDVEDRFSTVTHEEQIAEIKELIDSADRGDLTPQEFASKLGDLYVKNVNGLEDELSDLFSTQTFFEDNGVAIDREDITGTPEDVFSSSNLSNFDMVEGDAAEFSSGKRKRTQGSKRRPMSDADRQAFADGVRQRAATIPGKKRPGPSKDEFDTDKLSSGRLYFPSEIERNKIGNKLEDNVKIKFGRMSENNDRTPDGKWMLDASKLKKLLKDENGRQLSNEESAKLLGVSMREFEKMLQDGAGISESDAYTFIDQAFTGGTNPAAVTDIMEAIWGFDAVPYWYDSRRGNLLTRAEYEDYKEEGIQMDGELVPRDFDVVEKAVASEVSKNAFPVSALADSLGVESDKDLADAVTFEVDGEKITPTYAQLAKWKKEGVPTAIIEQLVDRGIIPSAGDVFGEEGVKFDNSIRQFDLWKNVRDSIEKSGAKAKYKDLDEVIGAAKVLTRLRAFEEGREGKFSKNTGKALRYTDEEVQEIVDKLNKKYNLNETVESIKGGGSMSSGRRAARRISNSGQEAVEKLSSGRKNNGAPENITPRMQNEIMGWAENATWSNFAQSLVSQFKAKGFLSATQWTRLLQLHDNSKRRR